MNKHLPNNDETSSRPGEHAWFALTKRLKMDLRTKMKSILGLTCSCLMTKKEKKLERILGQASAKIQNMLDLRSIVKHQRASETLLRLLLPDRRIRKMIQMQRSARVIEKS